MKRRIPLSVPAITGNEWKYIKECLDTGWVSSVGSYVNSFEDLVAKRLDVKHAVASINGTSALHVSLVVCGLQPQDEVIVPALTFIAPVNAVRYCGARPLFVDCDPKTLCMDIEKLAAFLDDETVQKKDGFTYRKNGSRIKVIIPVHVFGHPVDMDPLIDLCTERNIDIIEDATESLGSEYKGRKTGGLGRAGCLSFNGNKIITTGGGGMVVTSDSAFAHKVRHLTTQAKSDGTIEYDHDEVGYNYRLSNIQAAMGVAQIEKLDEYITTKRTNAGLYKDEFRDLDGATFLWEAPYAKSNFWFYTLKVAREDKDALIEHLIAAGIEVRPIWKLINTLPMYRDFQAYRIGNAYEAYDTCINLPCSVGLSADDIKYVAAAVKGYFKKRSGRDICAKAI